jgi:predicted acylesterase/phospholipase RssA
MRVAYQAGALRALEEEGLTFFHADGTSGGTINLAMLFSGLSPAEMCDRWRTLDVRRFVSLLPIRKYLRGLQWPAFGGAEGIVRHVYPHLGIDVERIRAARGMVGTFNVCDYTDKTNRAVPHTEADESLLVAGVSLPMLMPPVERGGDLYVDSVWIKDANPTEAVRRGCEEIWLVWCIGNTGVYRSGAFNQYVHMIELSANGGLFEELAHLRAQLGAGAPRLHVIKPEYPLPLDPDFYLGRIDAAALIASGYRDAKRYLATRSDDGVPYDDRATRMRDERPGAAFAERLAGDGLVIHVRAEVHDLHAFLAGPERTGDVVGVVDSEELGHGLLARSGSFELVGGCLRYALVLEHEGRELELVVRTPLHPWGPAEVSLGGEKRRLGFGPRGALARMRSLQATGTDSFRARVEAVARLGLLLSRSG